MNPASVRPIVNIQEITPLQRLGQQLAHYFHSNRAIFFLRLVSGGGFLTLAIAFLYTYLNPTGLHFDPKLNQDSGNYLIGSYICFAATFLWWWGPEGIVWSCKAIWRACKKQKVQVSRVRFQRVDQVVEV